MDTYLQIRLGDEVRRLPFQKAEMTLGRGANNDVVLTDDLASRAHAVIQRRGGAFYIRDLGSTNGTRRANGERITSAERLAQGETIVIGKHLISVVTLAPTPDGGDTEVLSEDDLVLTEDDLADLEPAGGPLASDEGVGMDARGETNHRHTSHLAAMYPLDQINPRDTPDLATAAETSLKLRMNSKDWEDVEWSAANAICYYARLRDGEAAHRSLVNLLSTDTDNDLLTFSRGGVAGAPENIFIIDGNEAGTAGIAEMLLQSYGDEVDLLPALPPEWPDGRVTGLRARGGLTVDIAWHAGRVTSYRIASAKPRAVNLRVNGARTMAMSVPLE